MIKELLVEGTDEAKVIVELFNTKGITRNFEMTDSSGYPKLRKGLPTKLKGLNHNDTLGIVVDADDSMASRWQSIRDVLGKNDYEVPKKLSPKGGIFPHTDDFPTVGVWIMPNNTDEGMTEDFIQLLIHENDQLIPIAREVLDKIKRKKLEKFKPTYHSKALIHTWLAWQKIPGTPLWQAIFKNYIDTDKQLCQDFIAWLQRLFNTPQT